MDNSEILEKRNTHIFPTKVPYYQTPLQLVRAKGSFVWDENGNEYLDAIGGIVSISVGHNHPKIISKMKDMIAEDAIQHTTYLYLSKYMPELAEKIANEAPGDFVEILKKLLFEPNSKW